MTTCMHPMLQAVLATASHLCLTLQHLEHQVKQVGLYARLS